MVFSFSEPGPSAGETPTGVRRIRRRRCRALDCALGEVVDLSTEGMRLRRRGAARIKQGEQIELSLALMSTTVHVKAVVIWTRKIGFRKREVGLQFVDLSAEAVAALTEIVQCASKIEQLRTTHAA